MSSGIRKRRRDQAGGGPAVDDDGLFVSPPSASALPSTRRPLGSTSIFPTHHDDVHQRPHLHNEQTIQVQHSCLLIPVMFGVWWYWTKRKARSVLVRLRLAPPMDDDDDDDEHDTTIYTNGSDCDPFHSWQDVSDQQGNNGGSGINHTLRWVRWFKGNTSKTTRARQRVHSATLNNLRKRPSFLEQDEDDDDGGGGSPLSLSTDRRIPLFGKKKGSTSFLEDQDWHCIHDTMGVEICAVPQHPSSSSEQDATNNEDADNNAYHLHAENT